jgi:CRISPR type I-E-associated protein CasB/Cse2
MKRWTREEIQGLADRLVAQLERWHAEQNRGPLARLRRGLSGATQGDAWPVLGWLFGELALDHPVFETVAGCFALYPSEKAPPVGNFGETMREAMGDKMSDEKEPHTRFRRLLACDSRDEICEHVRYAVRFAKAQDAPVNYRQLFLDLWWWNDRTKVEWAKAYWRVPAEPPGFGLAGLGTPVEEEPVPMPE